MERLETSIDLSTDWLEVQYLMSELEELKALYDSSETEAANSLLINNQAKASMGNRAIATQLAVPVQFRAQIMFRHAPLEHIEPLLALTAADDLADAGGQHIHERSAVRETGDHVVIGGCAHRDDRTDAGGAGHPGAR